MRKLSLIAIAFAGLIGLGGCAAADVVSMISPGAAELVERGTDAAAKATAKSLQFYCAANAATPAKRAAFKAKIDYYMQPLANGNKPTMVEMDCDGDGLPDAIGAPPPGAASG